MRLGKRKARTYAELSPIATAQAVEIRCLFHECGAYRWAVPPTPINWDNTWRETSVGWVCPSHVREAQATSELARIALEGGGI